MIRRFVINCLRCRHHFRSHDRPPGICPKCGAAQLLVEEVA